MGHISETWELLLCEYWRKSMIIGEQNTDLKRLKLRFLTEIGRLHWNPGEKVAHFVWFGEPWFCTDIPFAVHFNCVEKILHEELKHMTIARIFFYLSFKVYFVIS
jgi:hypothetical protein